MKTVLEHYNPGKNMGSRDRFFVEVDGTPIFYSQKEKTARRIYERLVIEKIGTYEDIKLVER